MKSQIKVTAEQQDWILKSGKLSWVAVPSKHGKTAAYKIISLHTRYKDAWQECAARNAIGHQYNQTIRPIKSVDFYRLFEIVVED